MKRKENIFIPDSGESGTVLVVAMWVIFALAGLALTFARTVRVDLAGTANYVTAVQLETAARSVNAWLISQFAGTDGDDLGQPFAENAPWQIGEVLVWIVPGSIDDDYDPGLFAVRDEGSRINLNFAPETVLSALPGATPELAAAIMAWRGEQDGQPSGMADNILLADPFPYKQGPFETVEELLLLTGVWPGLLYGAEAEHSAYAGLPGATGFNRSGFGLEALAGVGWFDYLTVYTREPDRQRQRGNDRERLDVNQADSRGLRQLLQPLLPTDELSDLVNRLREHQPYENILDFFYETGISLDDFSPLLEQITVGPVTAAAGLLNINTAPRHVILCLPGIGEQEADDLISRRHSLDADRDSILWITGVLPREIAVPLGNMLTTRSFQFSAEIVATDLDDRVFRRYRTVIDAGVDPPRILYWKDISHRGWPAGL